MGNPDIVHRAKEFAVRAHTSIVHLRKYTRAPYATHLENVVGLVASATGNPEMLAAAWLHDVVEDMPVTIEDVEREFGFAVAGIVASLTDISQPSDGNRAARKEKDRQHLAQASPAAKTVKLADLIDNCRDICRNDERFAPVYLEEMRGLLEVLREGDPRLFMEAEKTHEECSRRFGNPAEKPPTFSHGLVSSGKVPAHVVRVLREAFTLEDVAEPVRFFDADRPAEEMLRIMAEMKLEVACIRKGGLAVGYVRRKDLGKGCSRDYLRPFRPGQILSAQGSLIELIRALTIHEHIFVSRLGELEAVAGRESVNTPVVRMWIFGIVTLTEMLLVQLIEELFPNGSWETHVAPNRLRKALAIRQERERRGQGSRLLECLQLSDKGQILAERPEMLRFFGFDSKRTAKKIVKELESLRNNLAHSQDLAAYDWAAIARTASRIDDAMDRN